MLLKDIVILNEVSNRLRCNHLVDAVSATPVLRLASDEGANGAEIALVAQEIRLLLALGPEADGVRESIHGLPVASNERATKVDVFDGVFL
jgi:hypothetical protein